MVLLNELLKWVSTLSDDETKFLDDSILNPLLALMEYCDPQKEYPTCDTCIYQELCYNITDLIKSIIEFTKKK